MSSQPGPTNLCGLVSCPGHCASRAPAAPRGRGWAQRERNVEGGVGQGQTTWVMDLPGHPESLGGCQRILRACWSWSFCPQGHGAGWLQGVNIWECGTRHTRPGAPCAAPGCGRDCRQAQKLKCFLMLTSTGHAEHFFQGCWKAHVLHAFKAGQIVAVQKMY